MRTPLASLPVQDEPPSRYGTTTGRVLGWHSMAVAGAVWRPMASMLAKCLLLPCGAGITVWKPGSMPMARLIPRKHQSKAVEAIVQELAIADRATVVMACGTGKTAVGLWASEAVMPSNGSLLLLYPRLSLIQQALPTWMGNQTWGAGFRAIAVCSDASVAEGPEGEVDILPGDLPVPVTTDPVEIAAFLSAPGGPRAIFATYQSAWAVGAAARAVGMAFDLGTFDEAHRTAGRRGSPFTAALDDEGVPIRKRLFMTATPKVTRRQRRGGGLATWLSMDDQSTYGRTCHRLSLREAVNEKIICGYKILVSTVTAEELGAQPGDVTVEIDGRRVAIEEAASRVALARAVERTGASKVFTFHSEVARSREFAEGAGHIGIGGHMPSFDLGHIDSTFNAAERAASLRRFGRADKALRSNVGCLIEGVDAPEGDLVAFMDRKESQIDITQAIGRVLRKPEGSDKDTAYVLVPLLIHADEGEKAEEAVARSGMHALWDIITALMDTDDVAYSVVARMQEARARGEDPVTNGFRDLVDVIGGIGATVDLDAVRRAVAVSTVTELGRPFDYWLGKLQNYAAIHGTVLMPKRNPDDELNLGGWSSYMRQQRENLDDDQVRRLEALPGWTWHVLDDRFSYKLARLRSYLSDPDGHDASADGFGMASFITQCRQRREVMKEERRRALEEIPGWRWNYIDGLFWDGFAHLKTYADQAGNCMVPAPSRRGVSGTGFNLYQWLGDLRRRRAALTEEQTKALEALPGWSWDPMADRQGAKFKALTDYVAAHGTSLVPGPYAVDGFALGRWLTTVRDRRNRLSSEQVAFFEALPGWTWEPRADQFWSNLDRLKRYWAEGGTSHPPKGTLFEGLDLGVWTQDLRRRRKELTEDYIAALDSAPEWSWRGIQDERFHRNLALLRDVYVAREGTAVMRNDHMEGDVALGEWCADLRKSRTTLSPERVAALGEIPGWTWAKPRSKALPKQPAAAATLQAAAEVMAELGLNTEGTASDESANAAALRSMSAEDRRVFRSLVEERAAVIRERATDPGPFCGPR